MNRILLIFLLSFGGGTLAAQETADTLTAKRRVFSATAYSHGKPLSGTSLLTLYGSAKAYDAEKQLKDARILIPSGAGVSVAGLALTVKSLLGTERIVVYDQVEYRYFDRPIAQLLGGAALMAAGICLIEFGVDKKMKSIQLYNKKKKHDELQTKVGLSPSGHIRLQWSF